MHDDDLSLRLGVAVQTRRAEDEMEKPRYQGGIRLYLFPSYPRLWRRRMPSGENNSSRPQAVENFSPYKGPSELLFQGRPMRKSRTRERGSHTD